MWSLYKQLICEGLHQFFVLICQVVPFRGDEDFCTYFTVVIYVESCNFALLASTGRCNDGFCWAVVRHFPADETQIYMLYFYAMRNALLAAP